MRVAVFGICGKMGQAMARELIREKDVQVVAGFDNLHTGQDIGTFLNMGPTGARIYDSYEKIKQASVDTIVDFTRADICLQTISWAIDNSINIVVGTTGIKKSDLESIKKRASRTDCKVLIAPNFSIGAVIMVKLSGLIARYFDNCEIIEMHHDKKQDAPSGTAISTSEVIADSMKFNNQRLKDFEAETVESSRGGFINGIHTHSIRLPGLLAHQKVMFGAKGQTFTLSHDSIDRAAFYPGVIMALRNLDKLGNYTYGLDKLIQF